MLKKCACGKSIRSNHSLCKECLEIYGTERTEWPEWLRWQVADIQREWDYDRKHDELEFIEDVDYDTYPDDDDAVNPCNGAGQDALKTEWGEYQDVDALIKAEKAFTQKLSKPTSPNRQAKIDQYWLTWHNKYHTNTKSAGCEYCK